MTSSVDAGGAPRTAFVTGASAGIGAAFARRLARDDWNLVLVARRRERLEVLAEEVAKRHGVQARVLAADLAEAEGVGAAVADLEAHLPDLLVNNAGFGTVGRFAELDPEREEREIRLNVLALVRLTRAVLPGMVARGSGAVIQVSSLAGEMAAPYNATYGATKAFVTRFSEALFEELRGTGVRIQALLPGFTRTEFQESAGLDPEMVPSFAWMSAEQVVEASLEALERQQALCIPGMGNRVLAAFQSAAPRGIKRRIIGAALRRTLR